MEPNPVGPLPRRKSAASQRMSEHPPLDLIELFRRHIFQIFNPPTGPFVDFGGTDSREPIDRMFSRGISLTAVLEEATGIAAGDGIRVVVGTTHAIHAFAQTLALTAGAGITAMPAFLPPPAQKVWPESSRSTSRNPAPTGLGTKSPRCNRYGRLPSWRHTARREFSRKAGLE